MRSSKTDAPTFRIWPPVALGVPLMCGWTLTATVGDPVMMAHRASQLTGAVLILMFAIWNGWTLSVMAASRTAILPRGSTNVILRSGPFRVSRNPLYLGLIALDVGLALLTPSVWALLFVPLGVAALRWGAVGPEERYLAAKFGADYEAYRASVRRWL
ncbi:MAG: isoprenylcysteine carboxylmethyltransferase family protein [Mycobacterium sp.]|nr:isoprenylcysteine carboxylmethyltransferase family protein [Mycobacterium sp.]